MRSKIALTVISIAALLMVSGLIALQFVSEFVWSAIYVMALLAVLIYLDYLHYASRTYECPECGTDFDISLVNDLRVLDEDDGSKCLKCPKCREKECAR
jgi:hypothetical protein